MKRLLIALALVASACGGAAASTSPPAPSATPEAQASPTESTVAVPSTLPLYVPDEADGATDAEVLAAPLAPLVPVSVAERPVLPAQVVSADGSVVTVLDASRVLPLWGNLSEIVFSLGLGDRVVGRDSSATFPEAAGLPLVTNGHDVSAESVLSLRPTLVLAQTDTGPPEALDQIRNAGVPVVVLDTPSSIDDAMDRIEIVSAAVGAPLAGAALTDRTQAEIEAARAAVPAGSTPLRVAFLYMRGTAGVYLLGGPGSGADSMITAAGALDAGTEMGLDRSFTPLTSEALVSAAPDVILMTTTGLESVGGRDGLLTIPGIEQTPAGRDGRVITVEDGVLYSFGPRTAVALRQIVEQLHAPSP